MPGADRQHKGFFERANGGTLFLDEITEMSKDLQVKLLRVLETGTFLRVGLPQPIVTDVRVIAATNRQPDKAVAEGKLRDDLYHRLNVFPIQLPPLREREGDVELLAKHFLEELNRQEGQGKTWTMNALERLRGHHMAGNVRELRNLVHRAFILADREITAESVPIPGSLAEPDSGSVLQVRVGSSIAESCTSCHTEMRGPVLWEHAPVRENCATCHDPHGSSNDRMLVVRMPMLCQRCHIVTRHPASLYDRDEITTNKSNRMFGRSCVNCHQNIHGSNHPSGQFFMR